MQHGFKKVPSHCNQNLVKQPPHLLIKEAYRHNLLSLGRTVMLMPGSLSLMKGGFPARRSSSLIRRTFFAQTFPWTRCFSSCRLRNREIHQSLTNTETPPPPITLLTVSVYNFSSFVLRIVYQIKCEQHTN